MGVVRVVRVGVAAERRSCGWVVVERVQRVRRPPEVLARVRQKVAAAHVRLALERRVVAQQRARRVPVVVPRGEPVVAVPAV